MNVVQRTAIALLSVLAMCIPETAVAADDHLVQLGYQQTVVLIDQMPPVMRAAYMKGIRDELIAHGYDPGPNDGTYDDRFTSAIQHYQIDAGLRPDGVASKALLEHLLFALPKVYADGSRGLTPSHRLQTRKRIALAPPARPTPHPDTEPVPSPAPRLRVTVQPLDDRAATGERLRPSARQTVAPPAIGAGAEGFVSRTQRVLRDRGYYNGPIDGRFSDALSKAIRAFQKNNRLPATGVIDAPLLAALS